MSRWGVVTAVACLLVVASAQAAPATGPEGFERIVAPDGQGGDAFGMRMVYDGNRLVVGAPYDRLPTSRLGSVWVFTRHGLGWHAEKITPAETWKKGGGSYGGRRFGIAVDVAGDRIVVGAQDAWIGDVVTGGVFVFDYVDGEWVETILESEGIEARDCMGHDVALSEDGTRVLAGSWKNVPGYHRPGKAILWELVDGEWVDTVFEPGDGEPLDRFGASVGFGDGFIVVGAPYHDHGARDAGAVYVYEQVDGEWVETELLATEPKAGGLYGIFIDTWGHQIGIQTGDTDEWVFAARTEDGWTQEMLDLGEEGPTGEEFLEESGLPGVGSRLYKGVFDGYVSRVPGAVVVLERSADAWEEVDRYEGTDFGVGFGFGFGVIPLAEESMFISAPWFRHEGNATGVVFAQGIPPACGGWEPTIVGTDGGDVIRGTPGDDVILPGGGQDVIHTSGGRDVYCLEDGDYRFTGPVGGLRYGPGGMETIVVVSPIPEESMLRGE